MHYAMPYHTINTKCRPEAPRTTTAAPPLHGVTRMDSLFLIGRSSSVPRSAYCTRYGIVQTAVRESPMACKSNNILRSPFRAIQYHATVSSLTKALSRVLLLLRICMYLLLVSSYGSTG